MMNEIYYARFIIAAIGLTISSWQDWKSREINDLIWVFMAASGTPLLIYEAYVGGSVLWIILSATSILFSIVTGLTLYKLDLFGGADAKALISLSILIPVMPEELSIKLNTHPITSISIFNNSILLSTTPSIYLLLRNTCRVAMGEKIFTGLEEESIVKKILAMMTGYRMSLSELKDRRFLYPIEEVKLENGIIKRRLSIRVGASSSEEKLEDIINLYDNGVLEGDVWVTPALPLIIFIAIGTLITFTYGDIVMKIIRILGGIRFSSR
jgi:preflagellin peptidase FlaK